jgi:hypothetical protein
LFGAVAGGVRLGGLVVRSTAGGALGTATTTTSAGATIGAGVTFGAQGLIDQYESEQNKPKTPEVPKR